MRLKHTDAGFGDYSLHRDGEFRYAYKRSKDASAKDVRHDDWRSAV